MSMKLFRKPQTIKDVLIPITLVCGIMTKILSLLTTSQSFRLSGRQCRFVDCFIIVWDKNTRFLPYRDRWGGWPPFKRAIKKQLRLKSAASCGTWCCRSQLQGVFGPSTFPSGFAESPHQRCPPRQELGVGSGPEWFQWEPRFSYTLFPG